MENGSGTNMKEENKYYSKKYGNNKMGERLSIHQQYVQ